MGATRLFVAFVEVVRELRAKRGLSQEDLAHDAGMHRTYVGLVERGLRNPTIEAGHAFIGRFSVGSMRGRSPLPTLLPRVGGHSGAHDEHGELSKVESDPYQLVHEHHAEKDGPNGPEAQRAL